MIIPRVDSKTWDCPICHEVMDGDASISKRCFHVFHDTCIKEWVDKSRETCPICNIKDLYSFEIISNQNFVDEYQKWKYSPETYILDEQLLRPEELKGCTRRERLTIEELENHKIELENQWRELLESGNIEDREKARIAILKLTDFDTKLLCRKIEKQFDIFLNAINEQIERLRGSIRIAIQSNAVQPHSDEIISALSSIQEKAIEFKHNLLYKRSKWKITTDYGVAANNYNSLIIFGREMFSAIFAPNHVSANVIDALYEPAIPQPYTFTVSRKMLFKITLLALGIFAMYRFGRSEYLRGIFKKGQQVTR